ncbi:MAG: hypothetical protein NBV68_16575 [Erythrobacter sp.]|uniref:hypothetical protein n=1 Tax=Erythrobacter sp. TaxID=1042 RepID=UPI0025D24DE1|nr:hypothetical protein [Erythrobacter sp.]MCM0000993.1 hypothetical protein [Erythrobacter sp.]
MPVASERLVGWLSPKWLVGGVAVAACALLASYDVRLGMAAGTLLGVAVLMWLYVALRYGSMSGTPSVRTALVERSRQQAANRVLAARASGAQAGADPAEGA